MHQEISVPAKGHYWLRVGVHDRVGDRMGAVEVNLDNVNRTAPAAPAPTAAPAAKLGRPPNVTAALAFYGGCAVVFPT